MSPTLLIGALIAGALTTLAPCVLPLLPVIVGGSLVATDTDVADVSMDAESGQVGAVAVRRRRVSASQRRALVIAASLAASVMVFTLVLKASTALIGIPASAWAYLSGAILVVLGLISVFPRQWELVSGRLRLQARSTRYLAGAADRSGTTEAVLTGAALGPVFSSCSPLYAYVIVTVLPASTLDGLLLLLAYVIGLAGTLLVVALLGQRAIRRLGWAADPHGTFRRALGVVFIVVGLAVALGWDRTIQEWILQNSPIQPWNFGSDTIIGES